MAQDHRKPVWDRANPDLTPAPHQWKAHEMPRFCNTPPERIPYPPGPLHCALWMHSEDMR